MKTNTLQNKLKKMQLFFKKPLLFEKIIISLHLDKKSSVLRYEALALKRKKFQKSTRVKNKCPYSADLLVCVKGNSYDLSGGW